MRVRFVFIFISLFTAVSFSTRATTLFEPSTGIRITVNADGAYAIRTQNPAWTFGGNVGEPLSALTASGGRDGIGEYREISFRYDEGGPRKASIRAYRGRPVVLFTIKYLQAAKNAAAFPKLTEYPQNLFHLTYNGQFGVYSFDKFGPDSPWLFFDCAADAFLISPASHFLAARAAQEGERGIISGIDPRIAELPEGFEQSTILVVTEGINRAFETWGHALTALQGKKRPANDADRLLKYLGYWTDNGAAYYYKFDPALGYAGTMLAVRDDFRREGIPLGYLQLDSWFYPKGPKADWKDLSYGIYEYVADDSLFPSGLKDFETQLGLPLATHARWIDPSSPYHQQYQTSGNVVIDPKYWEKIAEYLADSGVATYEQDWLDAKAEPEFNLTDPEAYLDNMASACARQKLTMQYCMPLPKHYLQGSRYSNLTTMRTSGDRFDRERWDAFLYDSRLASALGVWPWCDVFISSETPNLILATLSAGPVGVGDAIGSLDKKNLLRVVRSDGVIVKPDFSLVPVDHSFIKDAKQPDEPMIAATSTDFGASKVGYVFAYTRDTEKAITIQPLELGFSGRVYVFNYLEGTGSLVTRGDFQDNLSQDYAYYVVVPVGKSGMAFLGDEGQFVTLGKQRIARFADDGVLHVTVAFANGEGPRTLFGYSPVKPTVKAIQGSAASPDFDAAKHLFRVAVSPGEGGQAVIEIRR